MADRVTFRARTAGVCEAVDVGSIKAVSITEPRVKYIKGWLTGGSDPADGSVECGHGTAYPMEVTLAQLEEIMYRVKTSELTSGSITFDYDSHYTADVSMHSATPPVTLFETYSTPGEFVGISTRGYHTSINGQTPDQPTADNFSQFFDVVYYRQTDDLSESVYYAVRDILGGERGIFVPDDYIETPFISSSYILFNGYLSSFKTGFSFTCSSYDEGGFVPSDYYGVSSIYTDLIAITTPYSFLSADFSLEFNGFVAVIEADNPTSSDARLFVGLNCVILGSPGSFVTAGTDKSWDVINPSTIDTGASLVLQLSTGSVSCPIYGPDPTDPATLDFSVTAATDFVMTATEWWPYKKLDGSPAWNATTGAPIGDISG